MIANCYKRSVRTFGALLLAGAMILCSLSSPASAAQISKFKANEDFAYAYWNDGSVYGELQVHRGGTVNAPQTYLLYYVYDYETVSESCGYGFIPNGDLTGSWQTGLSLRTDTSRMTDGYMYGSLSGAIAVDWKKSGLYSYSTTGTHEQHFVDTFNGDIFYRQSGTWHYGHASVSGTALSYSNWTYGEMGNNNEVNITIERGEWGSDLYC